MASVPDVDVDVMHAHAVTVLTRMHRLAYACSACCVEVGFVQLF